MTGGVLYIQVHRSSAYVKPACRPVLTRWFFVMDNTPNWVIGGKMWHGSESAHLLSSYVAHFLRVGASTN